MSCIAKDSRHWLQGPKLILLLTDVGDMSEPSDYLSPAVGLSNRNAPQSAKSASKSRACSC